MSRFVMKRKALPIGTNVMSMDNTGELTGER